MKETDTHIESLQALLDSSYTSGGAYLKTIQQESLRLTAREVVHHFDGACICDLATVDSKSSPFVAPVDVLFIRGKAWFSSAAQSQRFSNIRRNPRVSLARTVGSKISILIHGVANVVDVTIGDHQFLHEVCIECYGDNYDSWGLWGHPWAWIEPTRMFASRLPGG
jgi:uncharacterized pyridoxamine 5'-phosphate oxidase family protein